LPKARAEKRFLDGYLPYLLAQAAWLISAQFQRHLATRGIRFSVWRLLASLSGTAGLTIGELADILLLQQPTVTRIVDRIEKDGLVARKSASDDRRRVIVTLTPRGRALVAGLLKDAAQHQNDVLAAYSKSETETLFKVLRNVLARDHNGARRRVEQR
jgi:DNA-binding MarR family transcriptional regulator